MPKLSIIVPVYKVERYIERCISSLLNQTLTDIEIILVDDGSPDLCPQLCDEYAQKDSRVKVIHKANAGLGYARNSGLEIATGEYVAFVDSDDYVDVKMYNMLYLTAHKENADAVFCGFYTETRAGNWIRSKEVLENKVWGGDDVRRFALDMIASAPYEKIERRYQMSVWHSVYKRSIIEEKNIRFFSEREVVSEDIPFQLDFLCNSNKVGYIKPAFYYYCLNESSLTKSFKVEKFEGYKKLHSLLKDKLVGETSLQRIDRLFIGYCRSYLISLLNSNRQDKRQVVRMLIEYMIWREISEIYRVDFLPLNSRICYYLIIKRNVPILITYIRIISALKNMMK